MATGMLKFRRLFMTYIILDRDGVINYDSDYYIKSPDEWHPIPGSLEAIAWLNRAGYRVLIATNQSGIARGYYDIETLDLIHEKLMRELASVGGLVEEIFFCPHHPDENCECRKPKVGLFKQIQKKYPVNFAETFFIGDTLTDIQAAQTIGCKPILILSEKGKKVLAQHAELASVPSFPDLEAAVRYVLR